jgi:hypothetical protein
MNMDVDEKDTVQIIPYTAVDNILPSDGKRLHKKRLVDIINYINFQNGTILVNLQHKHYDSRLSLPVYPQSCTDNNICCIWVSPPELSDIGSSFAFVNFVIDKGLSLILVEGKLLSMDEKGITINLPDHCSEFVSRKTKRYGCKDIAVELLQNGVLFRGRLLEFSCLYFAAEFTAKPPQTFQWIVPDLPVYIIIRKETEVIYSGECSTIRLSAGKEKWVFVLEPSRSEVARFTRASSEETGWTVSPPPSIIFRHPLSGTTFYCDVTYLWASSFTVEEHFRNSGLFPGLVIPSVSLELLPGFSVQCTAQVVARSLGDAESVKHTLVILNMGVEDQCKLSALVHKSVDKKSYVCNKVDSDALWKFFFEAGFVYPRKYATLQDQKERFRNLYERLYLESPSIARHFIHQDKGTILGHIAMVRFYQNTWLIHHHAAIGLSSAGLAVLKQIGRNINDCRFLYSSHMDFAICYFRPQNKFPNRIFGGFVKMFNNFKGCSADAFAYLSFKFSEYALTGQREGKWEMREACVEDLIELKNYYEFASGGLMLSALDLEPDMGLSNELSAEYERLGFKRERYLFSLRCDGHTKAFFMVVVSDAGLNMSNLTNCIHVIIMDQANLSCDILFAFLAQLSLYYEDEETPLLIFPPSYLEHQQIKPEKIYNLWAFDCHYTESFLEYIKNLLRRRAEEDEQENYG